MLLRVDVASSWTMSESLVTSLDLSSCAGHDKLGLLKGIETARKGDGGVRCWAEGAYTRDLAGTMTITITTAKTSHMIQMTTVGGIMAPKLGLLQRMSQQ